MRIPRKYQADLFSEARIKLREINSRLARAGINRKPRLMVQLACGAGKTFWASMVANSAIKNGGSVVFLVHRNFLLDQTSATFSDEGINHSFLAAGKWLNPWTNAHVGMVGSMKSRMNKIRPPTICFIDEGHHGVAKSWKEIIEAWPDTIFIFLSATPGDRVDGIGLDEICDEMIVGPQVSELIEMGALSDYIYYTPNKPDFSSVKVRMGDYVSSAQDAEMTKAAIIGDVVRHYNRLARGKRGIYFFPSVSSSKKYADEFRAQGVRAVHIDADSTEWERKNAAVSMASGELDIITNAMIATEGWDLAAQAGMDVTVDVVGLCRRTKSKPLLIQMMMRAMRAKDYPGLILDHAGNFDEHGFLPDDDIEWTLAGMGRAKSGNASVTKECAHCFARIPIQATKCRYCDHECGKPSDGSGVREIEQIDGELEQVDRDAIRRQKKGEEWAARTLDDLIELGKKRGYRWPEQWAGKIWTLQEKTRREREAKRAGELEFYDQSRR